MKDIQQRFWEKVDIRGPDECWPWIAAVSKNGYGAFGFEGRVDGDWIKAGEKSCRQIVHGQGQKDPHAQGSRTVFDSIEQGI